VAVVDGTEASYKRIRLSTLMLLDGNEYSGDVKFETRPVLLLIYRGKDTVTMTPPVVESYAKLLTLTSSIRCEI
jgi:hypothetical protein